MRADPGPPRPTKNTDDQGGRWPSTREQFLWDLAPSDVAPNSDGVLEPDWGPPEWTEDVHGNDEIERMLQAARTYRRDTDETTRNLELKASRLATVLVALLTANVALVVFEITRLGTNPTTLTLWLVSIGVTFGLLASAFLVVGLTRAVDADQRMGITNRSGLGDVAHDPKQAMYDEAIGYAISNWTRQNKASRLINARAAVSRSMVFLIISAVVAIALAFSTTLSGNAGVRPVHHGHGCHQSGQHRHHCRRPSPPAVYPPADQVPPGTSVPRSSPRSQAVPTGPTGTGTSK